MWTMWSRDPFLSLLISNWLDIGVGGAVKCLLLQVRVGGLYKAVGLLHCNHKVFDEVRPDSVGSWLVVMRRRLPS